MDKEITCLPIGCGDNLQEPIYSFIRLLRSHSRVGELSVEDASERQSELKVVAHLRLELPSRYMAVGESPNGVRSTEPIAFGFPSAFPTCAPSIELRTDFPRTFAHIQPGAPEQPPVPCIFEGDINELYLGEGLLVILNQLIRWLENAALDRLIDFSQGWEPIRRDALEDFTIVNSEKIRALVGRNNKAGYFPFYYRSYKTKKNKGVRLSRKTKRLTGRVLNKSLVIHYQNPRVWIENIFPSLYGAKGKSICIVATPGKDDLGKPFIASDYQPETVVDAKTMYKQAQKYGCENSLKEGISSLKSSLRKCIPELRKYSAAVAPVLSTSFPVVVILCVRRPCNLIGEDSNIELIPYWFEARAPDLLPKDDETPVFPIGILDELQPKLLSSLSGQEENYSNKSVSILGCGSLGSKIAIHLARSGKAPNSVIDKGVLRPHNAARHGLLFETDEIQLGWVQYKAIALKDAITSLGQSTKPFIEDINLISNSSSLRKKIFPQKTWALINTTASLAVRNSLAMMPLITPSARVIETSLFATGRFGVVTIEGTKRNPNSLDLIALVYQHVLDTPGMASAFFSSENDLHYRPIGQGCSSLTMAIPDSLISMYAASITQGLYSLMNTGFTSEDGQIRIGTVSKSGMDITWSTHCVPLMKVIEMDNSKSWTIRLSKIAEDKITEECNQWSTVETGGILIGLLAETLQSFIVTDILQAPIDSIRTKNTFSLGVRERASMIIDHAASCSGALSVLGTWHSHLSNADASEQDYQTASDFAEFSSSPQALLIRKPSGYSALLC